MIELDFYSGRLGNCMFAYAFNRCIADTLQLKCSFPKGTEIVKFPNVEADSKDVSYHLDKYTIYNDKKQNPKTIVHEHDNTTWLVEKQFTGGVIKNFEECLTIPKVLAIKNIQDKYIITLGNFETGQQYLPYRQKLKKWFKFPEIKLEKLEFFKLHPDLGNDNYYSRFEFKNIHDDDLLISLRLEDYTNHNNLDRLLTYDFFEIILSSRPWNNVYILTNPGSIGHNDQYNFIKEFYKYDPILIRCYDPVMSMGFAAQFNNIAISQSTYSWWTAFLSDATTIYYPIPKTGPFSFTDEKYMGVDLRVESAEFKYVDYETRTILPDDYFLKIDYANKLWTR